MSRPVKMDRLPDGAAAAAPRPRKRVRTRAEMRDDLCRSLEQATHPLEIRVKRRALARLDQELAIAVGDVEAR